MLFRSVEVAAKPGYGVIFTITGEVNMHKLKLGSQRGQPISIWTAMEILNPTLYQELYSLKKLDEADVPASNAYGSPLSFVQKDLGSKFHTNKEIEKHGTTNGKISPFTLLSSPEKDVDDDDKEIIRLADLAKAPRPNPENSGGRSNRPGNEKASNIDI